MTAAVSTTAPPVADRPIVSGTDSATDLRFCRCGCGAVVNKGKSAFRQGHDQRLLGVLTRAHLAGEQIRIVNADGHELGRVWPMEVATELDRTAKHPHWVQRLQDARTRGAQQADTQHVRQLQAAQKAAEQVRGAIAQRQQEQEQLEPVEGKVKIGRWHYSAQQHADGSVVYQDKSQHTHPAPPKVAETFVAD